MFASVRAQRRERCALRTQITPAIMKNLLLTIAVAMSIAAIRHDIATASHDQDPALEHIARVADSLPGLRSFVVGDSVLVTESRTERVLFSIELEAGGLLALESAGSLADRMHAAPIEIDMRHLDEAAVGALTLDRAAGVWSLTHHVSVTHTTTAELSDVLARFAVAVEATRLRHERELSVAR